MQGVYVCAMGRAQGPQGVRIQITDQVHALRSRVQRAARLTAVGACLVLSSLGYSAASAAADPIRLAVIEAFSGPMANTGEAVWRNLLFAVEQVNARGGVKLADGQRRTLELQRFDSKGQVEEALAMLKAVGDKKISYVMQGNSSAVAAALIDAIDKHNQREPAHRLMFLNYAAVDPALTNEKCNFWHFRFDAHVDMRMHALTEAMKADSRVKKVYLIGQDYSFGHQVMRSAKQMIAAKRPDVQIVAEELHPIGRIRDFVPYVMKMQAMGADTVVTGNWGNDLTLLIKAAREAGAVLNFYTFYGNSLGAPTAIGEAGVGRVRAVSEWHPNAGGAAIDKVYASFKQRFPKPADDYFNYRNVVMIDMLARAMEQAGTVDPFATAKALSGMSFLAGSTAVTMRASDHQLQAPLYVQTMASVASGVIARDVEGSGYGFRTQMYLTPQQTSMSTSCQMKRP